MDGQTRPLMITISCSKALTGLPLFPATMSDTHCGLLDKAAPLSVAEFGIA